MIDPLVLKASGMIILFGALFTIFLHLLRKKIKLRADLGILPSFLLSYLCILAFYGFDPSLHLEETVAVGDRVIHESKGLPLYIIPVLAGILLLGYLLSTRLSKQTYRSLFHVIFGSLILLFIFTSINLTLIAVAISMAAFFSAEYLRKSEDPGKLSDFARKILNPALKDGEFEGYMASIFFLVGVLVVSIFLYPIGDGYAIASIAVLTYADPSATFIGRRFGRHPLKRNPQKTWEGSLAIFLVTTLSIVALDSAFFYQIGLGTALIVGICVTLSESLPLKIGDNLIIPLLAGMVMVSGLPSLIFGMDVNFWISCIGVFLLLGSFAYLTGMLDAMGVGVAIFFGILVWCASPFFLLSLLSFLIIGFVLTKFKYGEKEKIHAAEPSKGRRAVNPVVANGMIPTFMAVLYPFDPELSFALFAGALSAALADTAATEIGLLYPSPVMILTWKRVPPGTTGAISPLGEIAAVFGSLAIGGAIVCFALLAGLEPGVWILPLLLLSGIAGCTIDSFLGASLPTLSKEEINLFGTLAGAVVAFVLFLR
jgi:uncharacterized protein (TIGR00297 family)